jgi:DHA3 family macrolide efflux protein-like MFS transporter
MDLFEKIELKYGINRDFLFLLLGQFVSVLGERISTVVFFSIAVSIIGTDSSFLASALIAIQFIPLFLFGYFFGTLADEYNQKKLMILADIIRPLAILFLLFNLENIYILYFVVFIIGLFTALFEPSKKSIIPFLVSKDNLISLNKIFALFEIFAIFSGLLLGALILELFTVSQALVVNILSYLFSLFLILFIKYKPKKFKIETVEFDKASNKFILDIKKGLNYLKNNFNSRQVILNITLINFLAGGINYSSISDYTIRNSNGLDPGSQIGIFLLFIAVGALFTPLFNKLVLGKLSDSNLISYIFLIGGLSSVSLGILMFFNFINYFTILGYFFISGILVGLIYTRILYLLHTNTDEKFYGRVISINDFTSSISVVVGILIGGLINEFFTYKVGFIVTGLTFIIGYFYFRLTIKKLNW